MPDYVLPADGYFAPFHALRQYLTELASEYGGVGVFAWLPHAAAYFEGHPDHRRIDLWVAKAVSPNADKRPMSAWEIQSHLIDCTRALRARELGAELPRLLARMNRWVLPGLTRVDNAVRADLADALQANFPDIGVGDEVLRRCCLPGLLLSLRSEGRPRPTFTDLRKAFAGIRSLDKYILMRDGRMVLTKAGGMQRAGERPAAIPPDTFAQPALDTLNTVLGIQALMHALLGPVEMEPGVAPDQVRRLLETAAGIQWMCVAALRELDALKLPFHEELAPALRPHGLAAGALALASVLERMCGNFTRAARLGIVAILRAKGPAWRPPYAAYFRCTLDFLFEQGIWNRASPRTPAMEDDFVAKLRGRLATHLADAEYVLRDASACRPSLAIASFCSLLQTDKCVKVLETGGVFLKGWGIDELVWVRENSKDPAIRAAAMVVAARMGALRVAMSFMYAPTAYAEARLLRAETSRALGEDGAVALASEFAGASQRGAMWMDTKMLSNFKGSLRKVLRECPKEVPGHPNVRLFINHVRVGLKYNLPPHGIEADSEAELLRLANDPTPPPLVTMADFRTARFEMDPDSVLVSMLTHDGASVAVTMGFPTARGVHLIPPWIEETKDKKDWIPIISKFVQGVSVDAFGDVQLFIPPPLIQLCGKILHTAVKRNPGVKRILLHTDPLWNSIPWQFIFNTCLSRQREEKIAKQVIAGERAEGDNFIAIWRIPGVRMQRPKPLPKLPLRRLVVDMGCKELADIYADLQAAGLSRGVAGFLSYIAHGIVLPGSVSTRFRLNGVDVTGEEVARQNAGFALAVLHVCNASRVSTVGNSDDTSGIPTDFIESGARYVLAPGLPLPLKPGLIQTLEEHLARVTNTADFRQIEARYLQACETSASIGLYGLYSAVIAPRLRREAS